MQIELFLEDFGGGDKEVSFVGFDLNQEPRWRFVTWLEYNLKFGLLFVIGFVWVFFLFFSCPTMFS